MTLKESNPSALASWLAGRSSQRQCSLASPLIHRNELSFIKFGGSGGGAGEANVSQGALFLFRVRINQFFLARSISGELILVLREVKLFFEDSKWLIKLRQTDERTDTTMTNQMNESREGPTRVLDR